MPVRVAIRRRGWHRGGGGKGTIKNKIKKTVLSKSRCNRLTTRGIYVESFLGAIMLFVSVARQRNISRIFNDERPRCTDCIESRKPAPRYAQLFVADYERERPNPPLSTNNSSPVLKIVSNRYLKKKKKKEIIISCFRDTKNWEWIDGETERIACRSPVFFESFFPPEGEKEVSAHGAWTIGIFIDRTRRRSLLRKIYFRGDQRGPGRNRTRRRHRLRHCLRLRRCLRERGSTRLARFAKAPSRNRTPK